MRSGNPKGKEVIKMADLPEVYATAEDGGVEPLCGPPPNYGSGCEYWPPCDPKGSWYGPTAIAVVSDIQIPIDTCSPILLDWA